ncbi:PREDICTED: uncharacterized protein LOC107544546 [Miniopterus natalensis]|uniref:uncharacterized protein LOC107544546 n=1 Tax=Miniopterus natalensis TaxID=291302 RepID=UPI0007A6F7FB|nr:PREDICTED: uncharacterized protein LOC107544546 [Miniopterus natalensis]
MEKLEPPGAAGNLTLEPPEGATSGVPVGIIGVEAGSGRSIHSGGIIIRSPDSSWPSEVVAVHGSRPNHHPGEVVGHSLAAGTGPGGFNPLFPGTSVSGTSGFRSTGPGVHNSGCSPRSGSTCLHPHKPYEDRPRSILKHYSSTLMHKSPSVERKKSQHWDEMNIMATYHPAGKDYGFMKVDEPSTPYHRLQDSDEHLLPGPSHTVTPEALTERLATMDSLYPKVLQYGDNRSSGSSDSFSKTYSSDFEKRRKAHYNEGKFLKTQKNLPLDNNKNSNGYSESLGSGGQGVMLGPGSKPVERGWAGGLARGVKDEIGLVTRNQIPEAKDSSAFRNQSPASTITMLEKEADLQRKEYYSKRRYLRCCPHPELEEDTEDEQEDSCTSLNWVRENSIRTEVRLLDHKRSPLQDHRPSRTP